MMNNNNPWAGLASYEDPFKSERKLKFCGRDNDIYDVTRLIDDNLLLILYGKSGIGKTSLLNAGVFPKLRLEQYLPVSIRLGTLEANASYQEAVISAIENAIEEVYGSKTTYDVVEEQTDNHQPDRLWNYFARHRFANAEQQPLFPVVVLDQFEEVLRNTSLEHVGKAQALLNQLQYLIDESHALSDCIVDGKEYFYDFNFRFVISIREDELYLLEDNIDDLSLSMFRNCRYRLRSLSEQGARDVITKPGKNCILEEQQDDIVKRIIALSKRLQNNDIDTLLLSLVCAGTYDKKAGEKLTLSDLAVWKSNPMEVYYQDAVKGLSTNQVRYIQQHLIREDGSRKRVDAKEVKAALGESTYQTLTKGENRMLVLGEHEQVELLHDQLALAVYEERKAFEERVKKKKRRRKIITSGLLLIGLIYIITILFYSIYKSELDKKRLVLESEQVVLQMDKTLQSNDSLIHQIRINEMQKDSIIKLNESMLTQRDSLNSSLLALQLQIERNKKQEVVIKQQEEIIKRRAQFIHVKTKGKPTIPGEPVPNVSIYVDGLTPVITNSDGNCCIPIIHGETFRILSIHKEGYKLVNDEILRKEYIASSAPFIIVLNSNEDEEETKLRNNLQRKTIVFLQKKLEEIESENDSLREEITVLKNHIIHLSQ